MTPDAALVLCRFLFDSSAIFLWGVFACLSWLIPAEFAQPVFQRLRNWLTFALFLITCTTASMLPLRAATIGEGWADALKPDMLLSILTDTNVGQAWILQACAAVLLIASCLMRLGNRISAIIAGLLLATLTISGHAAMNSGWLRALHRLNDSLHLLSGGFWIGGLAPVLVTLAMLRDTRWQKAARAALMRFSSAGHVAVAVVIATGIINTILIVGSPPLDWRLNYQLLLSVKILFVGLLVALALTNRYLLVPRLARNPSLRPLIRVTTAELALGLAVLGLVAVLGTLQPI